MTAPVDPLFDFHDLARELTSRLTTRPQAPGPPGRHPKETP
jgi:hypothetical protein